MQTAPPRAEPCGYPLCHQTRKGIRVGQMVTARALACLGQPCCGTAQEPVVVDYGPSWSPDCQPRVRMGGLEKPSDRQSPLWTRSCCSSARGSRKSTQDKLWLAEERQEPHWLHSSGVMGTTSSESQAVLQGVIKLFPSWPNFTRHHDGPYQTVCDLGTTSGHFVQLAGSGCSPRGPGTHYDNQANCKLAVTFPPLSLK